MLLGWKRNNKSESDQPCPFKCCKNDFTVDHHVHQSSQLLIPPNCEITNCYQLLAPNLLGLEVF